MPVHGGNLSSASRPSGVDADSGEDGF